MQLLERDADERAATRLGAAALPALAVWLVVLFTFEREHLLFVAFGYSFLPLATAGIILQLRQGRARLLSRALRARPLIFAGKISYGLSLLHLFVRAAVDQATRGLLKVTSTMRPWPRCGLGASSAPPP